MQLTDEMSTKNLYDVWGEKNTAIPKKITTAYRTLTLQFHSDKNPRDVVAAEKFNSHEAYEGMDSADTLVCEQCDHFNPHGHYDTQIQASAAEEDKEQLAVYVQFFSNAFFNNERVDWFDLGATPIACLATSSRVNPWG